MIRKIILLLCLASTGYAQDRFVLRDSTRTILNNADTDTVVFLFTPTQIPAQTHMFSDTTRPAITAYIPPNYARTAGSFDLWLNRHNLSGAADSFRVYYFHVDPWSGRPAVNDSTFIVGSASTFANILGSKDRGARYSISLNPNHGLWLVIRQGDLTAVRTKIRTTLVHTQ